MFNQMKQILYYQGKVEHTNRILTSIMYIYTFHQAQSSKSNTKLWKKSSSYRKKTWHWYIKILFMFIRL